MRLAIVSPFVDKHHGTERAVAELCERLAQDYQCEIHIFSQRVDNLGVKPFDSGLAAKNGAIYWHRVPRVPGPHLVQFLGWFFFNRISRWSLSLFGRLSFDLVLSPGINCSDADAIVVHALFTRLREVSSEAGAVAAARTGFFLGLHRRAYYALLARMERRFYSDSNVALAAVSRRTAALLAHYFRREDVRVIPNGVDVLQFSPGDRISRRSKARLRRNFNESDFAMLLVGNDWGTKGLGTILKAMATHPEKRIRLLVAGNDAPAPFQEMAKRLSVSDRCLWEPASTDVLDLYAACDLYVSPSFEDSFGLPVAESMACGLPVITSVFAGVAELIQDGADGFVLQNPRDTSALSELIKSLFSDSGMCRRIGDAAAKTAEKWTWDRNAAAIWEMLQDAAARKHSARP